MALKTLAKVALAGVLSAVLAPPGANALPADTALGATGELYQVRAGTYGDLFPGRRQTDRLNRILALEVYRSGVLVMRQPVPSTEGPETEVTPAVFYEDASQAVYVLWGSRTSTGASYVKLTSFDGTRWADAIEVSGNPTSVKSPPRLAITRDTVQTLVADGSSVQHQRTFLHLVWAEGDGRTTMAYYAPIILVDGEYLGWNPVYRLADLDPSEPLAALADPAVSLLQSPTVEAGRDGRTVVIGFVNAASRRQTAMQVNVLPGELQQIADTTRAVIIDTGYRLGLTLPAGRPQLAEKARAAVIAAGGPFESEVVTALLDRVQSEILTSDASDLTSLADKTRAVIIDTGVHFSHRGLRPANEKLAASGRIDQVNPDPRHSNEAASPGTLGHLLELTPVATRSAPQVGSGPVEMFVSPNGQSAIVSWSLGDRLLYRESQADGWSEVRELRLSDTTSIDRAYEILDQRVRSH